MVKVWKSVYSRRVTPEGEDGSRPLNGIVVSRGNGRRLYDTFTKSIIEVTPKEG